MSNILSSLLFGTAAAGSWASGDFSGGIASKSYSPYFVVIISQIFGITFLFSLILLMGEEVLNLGQIVIALGGGIFLSIGLVSLYGGLAQERMSIVAPMVAVIAAILPAIFGMMMEGIPSPIQILGSILALGSIWIVAKSNSGEKFLLEDLKLPILAGIGFSVFKIFIAEISSISIYWPLLLARIASLLVLISLAASKKKIEIPKTNHIPFFAFAGILDALGGIFFIFAVQTGRLDMASIFSSTHPAFTVLLARFIIKENVSQRQWLGILGIIFSLFMIAVA